MKISKWKLGFGETWNLPEETQRAWRKEELKELQEAGVNGDGDGEAWAENEMSTRCKVQTDKTRHEKVYNAVAWGVKRDGGRLWTGPQSPQTDVPVLVQWTLWNQLLRSCSSLMSDGDHSYKMHVSGELFIWLFIPSHTEEM